MPLSDLLRARGAEVQQDAPQPEASTFDDGPTRLIQMPSAAKRAAAPAPAASAPAAARPNRAERNQVVVFFSCKGGCGSTLLSINASHHYTRERGPTCLVDLDLQMGDALAALALQPRLTVAQAVGMQQRKERLDVGTFARHASGLNILSQVGYVDDLDGITSESVGQLVEGLRQHFNTVVVDGVRDFSDNALAVFDVADAIALVTLQDVLAIRRTRWAFGILRKIGFDPKDITIIVNCFDPDGDIAFLTLKRLFAPAQIMAIPSDVGSAAQSLNRGIPLHQLNATSSLSRNIARLASQLVGEAGADSLSDATVSRSRGWLSRLQFWRRS